MAGSAESPPKFPESPGGQALALPPVKEYAASATGETQIALNQLHAGGVAPIRYKKTCEIHGDVLGDVVMGYQYEKDRYVTVDPDKLQKLRSERKYSIGIDRFVAPKRCFPDSRVSATRK